MSCECMKRSKAEMTYDQLNAANNSACNNLAICKEKLFNLRAETTRLRQQLEIAFGALKHSRACLEIANEDGLILDTLWAGDAETLFDYMDSALAQIRELEK